MTLTLWLGTYLLHSTLFCGAAALWRRTLRRADCAEPLWRAAVFLPFVTATAVQLAGGLWTIGIGVDSSPATLDTAAADPTLWSGVDFLLVGWLLTGGALVLRDWLAHRLFIRRLGIRHPADVELRDILREVMRQARVDRAIRLTYSIAVATPVAIGRSEICLSLRAMRDLGASQLRALIAHEVAHIARRDSWWFAVLACVESVFFFQPLNRVARGELRRLAETACDVQAARHVCDRVAVARCLVEVAAWSRSAAPSTVLGVTGTSDLTVRVTRLLDPPLTLRISPRLALVAILLCSLSLPGIQDAAPSAEFLEGFAAGRRYAAGLPDPRLQALLERGRTDP